VFKNEKLNGLAVLALIAAAGWLASVLPIYYMDLLTKLMIFAVLALSLQLVLGTVGLVSLVNASLYGIGAYTVVMMQAEWAVNSPVLLAAAAVFTAMVAGLVVGALSIRTREVYFIMVTLAFAQMFYHVAHDTAFFGGSDGLYLSGPLEIRLPGAGVLDLADPPVIYVLSLLTLAGCWGFCRILLASRFGCALVGIGVNEQRMRAAGFRTYWYKLAVFTIAAGMSGLAGFLLMAKNGVITPEALSWHQSAIILLMVILGGVGRLWSAVLGAAVYVALEEALSSHHVVGALADHWLLLFGITIVVLVAALPNGVAGLLMNRKAG